MNPLKSLSGLGQSPWLDFMRRNLLGAPLDKLIDEDGLGGMTSNPAIFEKAIGHETDYDEQFAELMAVGDRSPQDIYEALAIRDIQLAADRLAPVYQRTKQRDGFVSLEVSPYLARDTEATIAEARRLWRQVDRPNLMVKVPGTPEGVPAIETLIAEGININVTLLFSTDAYIAVAEAFIAGLEKRAASGASIAGIASVASFFVSRIDALIDGEIDKRIAAGDAQATKLEGLKGKVAIANAKIAYQDYKRLFGGAKWQALVAKGAQPQRLLWASTGTKNKAYRDVLYVETLIGRDTVNTMPPATMDAFRDHGVAKLTIEDDLDAAKHSMATLDSVGISMKSVTDTLVEDGVQLFADAFDALLGAVADKRSRHLGHRLDTLAIALPAPLKASWDAAMADWRAHGKIRHLWAKDAALWSGHDEASWLGWLGIVAGMRDELAALKALGLAARDYKHVLLLGMGGSSLGPEVLGRTFGRIAGAPHLHVLDSTDPAQIAQFEAAIEIDRTLFIVASKSGSTLEPNILKQYFFARAAEKLGATEAGRRFVAITDPGSKMEAVAAKDGFGYVFKGLKSIGGRYSVLSAFGLVPAATLGVDLVRFLDVTEIMVRSCGPDVPPAANPGVQLGLALGVAAKAGRDKVTILAGPGLEDFGAWAEQLIAESTGKQGHGIIPVDSEPVGAPGVYGTDRVFAHLTLEGKPDPDADKLAALEQAGHPVIRIVLPDAYHLGQEFFRWEIATAVAGAVIGINPFDQPDVEASKIETRKLTDAYEASGSLPPEQAFFEAYGIKLYADPRNRAALEAAAGASTLPALLKAHFDRLSPGDYAGLLAYLPRDPATIEAFEAIRLIIRDAKRVATVVGFGPRFLHSTGQAYKGGPNSGVFLQITCDDAADLAVPGQTYSFGTVKAAQARGDFDVLAERGRRALRLHLGADLKSGIAHLKDLIATAVA
jgi:transaldolase/glucose-6-phosphate isomerase